jgi:hypothetical protein
MIEKSEYVETGVQFKDIVSTEDELVIDDIMNKPREDIFMPI